ncbi:HmuY family protein [Eisenibacter elegans]|uniref:HmuY family protein n=1 Tax=Eisenibacter elegans TaxID=997 RepID=UPI000408F5D5|nr:HmuY family protein [Eisenibacter elegans]
MKTTYLTRLVAFTLLCLTTFSACNNKKDEAPPVLEALLAENIHAPNDVIDRTTGQVTQANPFVKFSFATGQVVTGNNWDIAFKGTTIIINGGNSSRDTETRSGNAAAVIRTATFEEVTTVPAASEFVQDNGQNYAIPTGSGNGWYNYNSSNNLITPIPGRVLVFRTHDGKFAKVEILSYYQNAPAQPTSSMPTGYYTFRYIYQPDGNSTRLE